MKKILGLCLVVGLVGCESAEEKQKKLDSIGFEYSQNIVKNGLIDPESARFKNQKGFCGEVNSKNRMGGYTGFERFIILNPSTVIFEDERNISTKQFPTAWDNVCSKSFEFDDQNEVIEPKFTMPKPVYDKAKYNFHKNIATATPSAPVYRKGVYLYPSLEISCDNGKTVFGLNSFFNVPHDKREVSFQLDGKEIYFIPFENKDRYQYFASNEQLKNALKTSTKILFGFYTTESGIVTQEYNMSELKKGMKNQNNSCNWQSL